MSATFTPSRAARAAIASPIPRLPPDMNMTRSFSESAIAANPIVHETLSVGSREGWS